MRLTITALLCLIIFSCSGSKSAATESKPSKKELKGTWQVTNIRFVGKEGLYKVNLFDLADSPCFKNSEWVFIPNNGTGKFNLNTSNNCTASTNRILWSFYDAGGAQYYFQFKFVNEKNKPLSVTKSGYRMRISNLTPSTMETRVKTSSQGHPFDIVLTFDKISDTITL